MASRAYAQGDLANSTPVYSVEQTLLLLEKTNERLSSLPDPVTGSSFEADLKGLLIKDAAVLEKLIALLKQEEKQVYDYDNIIEEIKVKQDKLSSLSEPVEGIKIEHPTQEEFNQLTRKAKQHRENILEIKEKIRRNTLLVKSAPDKIKGFNSRKAETQNLINSLNNSILTETNDNNIDLMHTELAIAEAEQQITNASLRLLQNEINNVVLMRPLLSIEIQTEEKEFGNVSTLLKGYSQALELELKAQHHETEIILALKEEQAANAETPQERFIAEWETSLAFSKKNKSALEACIVTQQRIYDELDMRLQTEKGKILYFTNRLNRPGASAIPADRIKRELQRLKILKTSLNKILPSDYEENVKSYEAREFEIDDEQQNFLEIWQADLFNVTIELSKSEKISFEDETSAFVNNYKSALQEEKEVLITFIDLDQKIHRHILERTEVLKEIERIVWSSLFWIQDGTRKNFKFFAETASEFFSIVKGTGKQKHRKLSGRSSGGFSTYGAIIYGILLLLVLPALMFYLRKRIVMFAAKYNMKTLKYGHRLQNKIAAIIAGVTGSITLPVYFYIASGIIGSAGFNENVGSLFEIICFHAGNFFLLFFLNRAFFYKEGIAVVQFELNRESSRVIYKALQALIISAITLRLLIKSSETLFMISAIPELLLLLELIVQGVVIWWALRRKSPFVQNEILLKPSFSLQRYWPLISYAIFFIIIANGSMAIYGYNYTASQFSHSLFRSIIAGFLLPQIYKLVVLSVENIGLKRKKLLIAKSQLVDNGENKEDENREDDKVGITEKTKSFIRVLFYIAGVLIIANLWGIDDRALKTFDEMGVYNVSNSLNEKEIVSVGDLLRFLLVIFVTTWIVKNLKVIAGYVVFSRIKIDEGLKYAILTISRYMLFFISALFALAALHLDLGRLGWLVAAMGVGLGFGLQEIVSNFFCGIILLLERPIRVDDVVTIGSSMGKVTRINIRATTIMTFARQEVILPNRMLITQEVTNWTRGDNIIRWTIPIGVAYGSDIEKVSNLLLDVVKNYDVVLEEPAPSVLFMNHGESSLDFEVRVFLPNPEVRWTALDYINKEINRALAENGIEIPFPQRDIHIKSNVK